MKRKNRRKTIIGFVVLALLIAVGIAWGASYLGMQITHGYDPTDGDEFRYYTGTYHVPVVPESALTSTIAFGVASPYTVLIGSLPAGAVITDVDILITTVFDAGTTNVLVVGTTADPDHYVDAADVLETLVSTVNVRDKVEQVTVDTDVYIKYTQTGTAATTGAARVVIHYVVPGS